MSPRWLYYQVHGEMPARRSPRRSTGRGPARAWKYKAWIRTLGCCCCGTSEGIEAAHTGSDGGTAQKSSDYSCIPLCTDCHTAAPWSHHRDRQECERRIHMRTRMTVTKLTCMLNAMWKDGKEEAA
jgi:hypothetical protein